MNFPETVTIPFVSMVCFATSFVILSILALLLMCWLFRAEEEHLANSPDDLGGVLGKKLRDEEGN